MIPPTFPSNAELGPALEKLEAYPGSVILLAVEPAEARCNFCRVTWAWLSKDERRTLKIALERARKRRETSHYGHPGDSAAVRSKVNGLHCVKEGQE